MKVLQWVPKTWAGNDDNYWDYQREEKVKIMLMLLFQEPNALKIFILSILEPSYN